MAHRLIVADGQVTDGDLQDTINSIVEASNFALSIIVVGVGVLSPLPFHSNHRLSSGWPMGADAEIR